MGKNPEKIFFCNSLGKRQCSLELAQGSEDEGEIGFGRDFRGRIFRICLTMCERVWSIQLYIHIIYVAKYLMLGFYFQFTDMTKCDCMNFHCLCHTYDTSHVLGIVVT